MHTNIKAKKLYVPIVLISEPRPHTVEMYASAVIAFTRLYNVTLTFDL